MGERRDLRVFSAIAAILCMCVFGVCAAETPTQKRQAQFATVHRLAIAPPFYGTLRLSRTEPSAADHPDPKLAEYLDRLRKLQARTRAMLPERLAARTPFHIVGIEETEAALKALDLMPEKLYQNGGRMKGTKFANPDPEAVKRLAEQVHADAVVLDTMDEPFRSKDRLFIDPFEGIGVVQAHVTAKIGFWVLLADGTEAFQRVSDVVHPLTRIGNRQYLMADWQDANDLAIENFLDELNRYTPEKPASGRK